MSRILVFDLENKQTGEVHAVCNRGWAISDGGSTTFSLTNDEALKPWMQLGRMIYIDGGGKLPNWAGMIDTPWSAISPANITVYDIPYLLSLRMPYFIDAQSGDTGTLAMRFLTLANQLGDLYLREGSIKYGDAVQELPITNTPDWDQLKKLITNSGMEMQFRPEIVNNQLILYLDIQPTLGIFTAAILQDGENGNMMILDANLEGDFRNSVIGVSDGSTKTGKLYSNIDRDENSIATFRHRNTVQQFSTVSASDLQTYTDNYLTANSKPILLLQVGVRDTGIIFSQLRLGNALTVRATNLILPGGMKGWGGQMRIQAMNYDEGSNQVTMTLIGVL